MGGAELLKILADFLATLSEYLTSWIRHRKPHLHIHFEPGHALWSVGQRAERDGTFSETMNINFTGDFSHTGHHQSIILIEAYPEGTTACLPLLPSKFDIPPEVMATERVAIVATPVIGEKGKAWRGRIVFVDQYNRKYKSNKMTFQWIGT